ncbi:alpha amylase C-terminal domain-containing protein [Dyadobacter arcticus]|uniref:Alpha-amylase/branching enzyme C-terminal all beta domain-containing protein n=1 Tax=Dyadobacter arcticus TaxID=1078754 RepID=A0ABX0UJB4_9BACT|nr:alpha amylase C-terminal domain-containing protein [Dyadobacter arcticus]NIJ52134.1 hypothetical protein [Dyadobacter arcticus]
MNTEISPPSSGLQQKETALQDFLKAFMHTPASMRELQSLIEQQPDLLLGDHYWRTISQNGIDFNLPSDNDGSIGNLIAFSRISNEREVLCAINLHTQDHTAVYVTLDDSMHLSGSKMNCLYASAASPQELNVEDRNGKAVRLTVPPRGLVIYA